MHENANFAHTMVGTPYYLSPEMCEEKPYNEKINSKSSSISYASYYL